MTRPAAAIAFAAAAVLVATSRPATTQPYTAAAPAAVQVPYYGAVYGGPAAASKADVARVIELLEAIERNTAPKAAAVKAGPDPAAVAKARCAGCHTPGLAEAKGGGFILFADDKAAALKPLSARERTRVREAVAEGTMPPGGKLSPAERSALSP